MTDEQTAVYRLYDAADALLYIGMSNDPVTRCAMHAAQKDWWPEVVDRKDEWFTDRDAATLAEAAAIWSENPRHNVKYQAREGASPPTPPLPSRRRKPPRGAILTEQVVIRVTPTDLERFTDAAFANDWTLSQAVRILALRALQQLEESP